MSPHRFLAGAAALALGGLAVLPSCGVRGFCAAMCECAECDGDELDTCGVTIEAFMAEIDPAPFSCGDDEPEADTCGAADGVCRRAGDAYGLDCDDAATLGCIDVCDAVLCGGADDGSIAQCAAYCRGTSGDGSGGGSSSSSGSPGTGGGEPDGDAICDTTLSYDDVALNECLGESCCELFAFCDENETFEGECVECFNQHDVIDYGTLSSMGYLCRAGAECGIDNCTDIGEGAGEPLVGEAYVQAEASRPVDTDLRVEVGQTITFVTSGEWCWGEDCGGAEGRFEFDENTVHDAPIGSLTGLVDRTYFDIGSGGAVTMPASGTLWLLMNDRLASYADNDGAIEVLLRSDGGAVCGDGGCEIERGETCESCSADCGSCFCGNGTCDDTHGECGTCPQDCPGCATCGDGFCDTNAGESCSSCSNDCGGCFCGNGTCDPSFGETCDGCPGDCPVCSCGDGLCNLQAGECGGCPGDCSPGCEQVCDSGLGWNEANVPLDLQCVADACCAEFDACTWFGSDVQRCIECLRGEREFPDCSRARECLSESGCQL